MSPLTDEQLNKITADVRNSMLVEISKRDDELINRAISAVVKTIDTQLGSITVSREEHLVQHNWLKINMPWLTKNKEAMLDHLKWNNKIKDYIWNAFIFGIVSIIIAIFWFGIVASVNNATTAKQGSVPKVSDIQIKP